MEHDERYRRDSDEAEDVSAREPIDPEPAQPSSSSREPADAEATGSTSWDRATGEGATEPAPAETTPAPPWPAAARPTGSEPSAAEIESWPSQDATAASAHDRGPEPAEPVGSAAPGAPAWPSEPPAAGTAAPGTWPTAAPERHEQAASDFERAGEAPPPEVEAYPTESEADERVGSAAVTSAHAVPAGESMTGESTQCPRCGTENRPGLAFCRNCGQRLIAAGVASTLERPGTPEGTMACPRCGTHNRAGVAFCQNCGANLRGTAPGYVPPAVAAEPVAESVEARPRGAVLGPVVLLIGLVGLVTGYLLPFAYGAGSLFERAFGADGYGAAFWSGYPEVGAALADQVYFGLAGPIPLLGLLLLGLAVAGFIRAVPGPLQTVGLVLALLWSVGLIVLFIVVELAGNWSGDLVGMLRVLTPAGIIFFLSSLIILIGTLTRFGRS